MRSLVFVFVALVCCPVLAFGQAKQDEKKKSDSKTTTKAPAADADPLKALGASVDLPEVKYVGKWATLAKTTIPENLIVTFSLRGGDRCLGVGKKAELKEAAGGRSWQCLATRDGAEPVELGVFRIENGAVQFAWSSGAEDFPDAGQLRNAAFEIAVGTSKKVVGLRKPVKGDPLTVSYDEPSFVTLDIPDAPPARKILIEIDMPSPEYKSKNVNWRLLGDGPALKGNNDLMWAESIRLGHLTVKLETAAGKSIKVTATPMFWIADREKPQKLTDKNLTTALGQIDTYQKQLTATRDQFSKAKNLTDAQKAQRDAMTKELAVVRKTASDLENLKDFIKSVKLGKIQLKVSHELEPGYIVPLLTTK